MFFSDFPYENPDLAQYEIDFITCVQQFIEASEYSDAKQTLHELNHLRSDLFKNFKIASIRFSIDTNDHYYGIENEFWDYNEPIVNQIHKHFYESLLDSPFRPQLEKDFPETLFLFAEDQSQLMAESVIVLMQQENDVVSQYSTLIASAEIEFDGKVRTLSELSAFFTDPDRKIRQAAQKAYENFFVAHEQELDTIFDQMVHIRHQQAQKLGFDHFVEYGDRQMNRWGYDRSQLQDFRRFILEKVVPINQRLYQRQQERLGLERLNYYDLPLVFPNGNPRPQANAEALVQQAQTMYHELSPETGAFFDKMIQQELLDLISRPGKQSGGYCEYIDEFKVPFIFANFNGTSEDVDVLTHEAGHAFQTYLSSWIEETELVFPTSDTAEIHSMSMEFLTWPWMDKFFGTDSEKYKFAHLSSALQFLPYGALVDHFQEEVYLHPDWSPAKRKNRWRELEQLYCPENNYQESEALARGIYWYRQGHIFESPFYYIDYTLAQVCALQFWERAIVEKDPTAWEDYLAICRVGGTKTFLETVQLGHLASPFDYEKMTELLNTVDHYLAEIPETGLS